MSSFDRAVESYRPRTADLAIFRVLLAGYILLAIVPVAAWLHLAPQAFLQPPIGFAALSTAPPPQALVLALNLLLVLFAAMLLAGCYIRVASLGTALTLFVLTSWAFSLGKIDHVILLVIAPLVIAFSGGEDSERPEAWPLALFAFLIGFAMFTAGYAKATTGWLDPGVRGTYGHMVYNRFVTGRETWLVQHAMDVDSNVLWKAADWVTVAFECGFLLAVWNRRWFCLLLSIACLFHVGVTLLFDINFGVNVVSYGAFVRWSDVPFFRSFRISRRKLAFVAAAMVGLMAVLADRSFEAVTQLPINETIIWLGAAMGAAYLVAEIGRVMGMRGPRMTLQTGERGV